MSEGARVESIDALRAFRTAMVKFAETCNVAMADAEGEVHRTMVWLESEQAQRWVSELRKRTEMVGRCQEAVRSKTLFKDSTGSRQSAVEEQKALAIAIRRKEEAEQKIVAVKKGVRRLQKELESYKGNVQRLSTYVSSLVPAATAGLERMALALEAYVALQPTGAGAPMVTVQTLGEILGVTPPLPLDDDSSAGLPPTETKPEQPHGSL